MTYESWSTEEVGPGRPRIDRCYLRLLPPPSSSTTSSLAFASRPRFRAIPVSRPAPPSVQLRRDSPWLRSAPTTVKFFPSWSSTSDSEGPFRRSWLRRSAVTTAFAAPRSRNGERGHAEDQSRPFLLLSNSLAVSSLCLLRSS